MSLTDSLRDMVPIGFACNGKLFVKDSDGKYRETLGWSDVMPWGHITHGISEDEDG